MVQKNQSGAVLMAQRSDEEISVRDHFDELLTALRRIGDERWEAHREVHAMGQRAIDEAVKVLNTRLETMNEFRAQISKERGEFVRQEIYKTEYKAVEAKMDAKAEATEKRMSIIEKWQSNMDGRFWMLGTLLTGVTILLNLAFMYLRK